jgi:formylglycine-generating enzyme required for sulfatase activity
MQLPYALWIVPVWIAATLGWSTFGQAMSPASDGQPAETPQLYRESIQGTLVTFEMVMVPGGPATIDEAAAPSTVTVKTFYIGRTEVTWDMYDVFALGLDVRGAAAGADAVARPSHPYGAPDYGWGHAGYPAISVTRAAAEAFCSWLSAKTGKTYRLPTRAEWARAAALASGDAPLTAERVDALAWHRGNSGARVHAVASKQPDALGLYDLFGNAAEWVTGDNGARMVRGGSFRDAADVVGPRAGAVQDDSWNERDPQLPKSRWWLSDGPFVGFRIVREP